MQVTKTTIALLASLLIANLSHADSPSPEPQIQYMDMQLAFPKGYKAIEIQHLSKGPLMVVKYGDQDRERVVMVTHESDSISESEVKEGCTYNNLLLDVFNGTHKSKCKSERVDLMKEIVDRRSYKKKWIDNGYSFFFYSGPGEAVLFVTNPENKTYMIDSDIFELEDIKSMVVTN